MPIKPSNRINQVEEYYFSKKLKEIQLMREAGHDVINLGIGSPDLSPPAVVIEKLKSAASQNDAHGYQPYQGIPQLHQAIKSFYQSFYGVRPMGVLPLIGSKEGITHLSMAYLDVGDKVLVPSLGYPTYNSVTRMVGGKSIFYPLEESNWEPDWSYLEALDTEKVKLMWVNYPHMPSGSSGNIELFERLVRYAKERRILLCHDNPYSLILNEKPLSIFNVSGAEQVALELGSLSKTYNMAGWRVGWIYGNPDLIKPILQIKSNVDSGMFKPIQLAAITALNCDKSWLKEINLEYRSRRNIVFQLLDELDCTYTKNQSGLFVWAKTKNASGVQMCDDLLEESKIFITPGQIFGVPGKDFVRVSLCAPASRLEEALNRIT